MKTLHLFAGAGGGLLADLILGHEPIAAVEWEPYACSVLRERRDEGWFPGLQVHEGDVRLFDPSEYAGKVDCIHAGFPCQDISSAGTKKGTEGERSNLYREVLRISRAIRPNFIFLENSPDITFRGLDRVCADISAMGFDARWCCLGSIDTGGCHYRKRWWMLAYPREVRGNFIHWMSNQKRRNMGKYEPIKSQVDWFLEKMDRERTEWEADKSKQEDSLPPFLCRIDDEMARNVDRLACVGNGQDPITAAAAWCLLGGPTKNK